MASAARLLAVFTALSVNVPSRERCVRPPSHHIAMRILKPRYLVNSRAQALRLCVKLSDAPLASVVALTLVFLCTCITLLFLIEITIVASSRDPFAIDVTRQMPAQRSRLLKEYSSLHENPHNVRYIHTVLIVLVTLPLGTR